MTPIEREAFNAMRSALSLLLDNGENFEEAKTCRFALKLADAVKPSRQFCPTCGPACGLTTVELVHDPMPLSHDKVTVPAVEALREALEKCLEWMEYTIPHLNCKCPYCKGDVHVGGLNWGGPISRARNALALADQTTRKEPEV